MSTIIALIAGFLTGRLLWLMVRSNVRTPVFLRDNWRGMEVPTAMGFILPVTLLLVEAGRAVATAAGIGDVTISGGRIAVLLVALGFGALGLLDDLAGADGAERGFSGHMGAMLHGRLTTGGMKLVGGFALALVAASGRSSLALGQLIADAALIALAANLGNLFDRRPGRCVKVAGVGYVLVLLAGIGSSAVLGASVIIGAAAALALDDLHERLMLGDAGANVLGGVLGMCIVLETASSTRVVALVLLIVLNAMSEFVSFSRVIDAVGPLRRADRSGQRFMEGGGRGVPSL